MDQIQDHRRSAATPMIIKWGCSSLVALLIWVSMADLSTVNLNSKGNCWEDITGAKLVGVPIGAEELNYGGHNNRPSSIHFYTQVWCPSRKRRLEPSRDGGPPTTPTTVTRRSPSIPNDRLLKSYFFGWKKILNIESIEWVQNINGIEIFFRCEFVGNNHLTLESFNCLLFMWT